MIGKDALQQVLEAHRSSAFSTYTGALAVQREIEHMKQLNQAVRDRAQRLRTLKCDGGVSSTPKEEPSFDQPQSGQTLIQNAMHSNRVENENAVLMRCAQRVRQQSATDAKIKYDDFIDKFENVGLFMVTLGYVQSADQALLEVIKYAKTFVKGSLTGVVEQLITEEFGPFFKSFSFQQQSSSTTKKYMEMFRNFVTNWKDQRHGEFSKHFCSLVSLLTLLNLVPETSQDSQGLGLDKRSGDFFLNGYRVFTTKVFDVQKDAVDVMELVFDTLLFFLERGYVALSQGNPSAVLFTDDELNSMDVEYALILKAVPLIESGRLSELRHPNINSIKDEHDYSNRLDAIMAKVIQAMKRTDLTPQARASLQRKMCDLSSTKVKLISAQQSRNTRVKPFSVCITGPSSAAKSSINTGVIKMICERNNFPTGTATRAVINESDKYDTEITAGTVAVTIDDFANTIATRTADNPTSRIINLINNVTRQAVKAELEAKGTVPVQPKIVTVTSNTADLDAGSYSNEPVSVLRRFEYFLRVTARNSHKDETGGFNPQAFQEDRDAWTIDVQKVVMRPKEAHSKSTPFSFITILEKQSFAQVLEFLGEKSENFFAEQRAFVAALEKEDARGLCPHGTVQFYCNSCRDEEILRAKCATQSPDTEVKFDEVQSGISVEIQRMYNRACDTATEVKPLWEKCVAMFFILIKHIKKAYVMLQIALLYMPARRAKWLDLFMPNVYGKEMRSIICGEAQIAFAYIRGVTRTMKESLKDMTFRTIFNQMYRHGAELLGFAALTALLVSCRSMLTMYSQYNKICDEKSVKTAECSDDEEDDISIRTVVFEPSEPEKKVATMVNQSSRVPVPLAYDSLKDSWKKAEVIRRIPTPAAVGATLEQMVDKIDDSLYLIHNVDEQEFVNAFPLCGNFWLVPSHIFPEQKEYTAYLSRTHNVKLGKKVHFLLDPTSWKRIPGKDFMVVRIPSSGDVPNLIKFISETPYMSADVPILTVSKDSKYRSKIVAGKFFYFKESVSTSGGTYDGYVYSRNEDCYQGLCMAPLIPRERTPEILGFHLCGTTVEGQRHIGFAGFISQSEVRKAISCFPPRFNVLNSGTIPSAALGVHYGLDFPVHKKSPVNFQRDLGNLSPPSLEIVGAHSGSRSTVKSAVKSLPISEAVTKHCGIPNLYGPPPFARFRQHWHADLEKMAHPCSRISPNILNYALDDVYKKYDKVFTREVLDHVAPLPLEVVTSGLDGVRGIDRMDLSTSVGFPLNKKKSHFATIVPGESSDLDITEIVVYEDRFYNMMAEMEETYASGTRAYPIFKGCMKDEATKIGKDKIRVFTGGQLAFNMIVRKYFLSITRLEHVHWKDLEGCVGINAHGPEWTDVANKLKKFDSNKYIAGDYSKYDKKMSPQVIVAGLSVYLHLAERSGNYTERDLMIMRGVITDVSCPLYEYDGVFVQLFSSWTSGVPITVDGNNIFNMLYLRYAYFDIQDQLGINLDEVEPFDAVVSACVYGDDNVMQVRDDASFFNHTSVQRSLKDIGMEYTMADKETESVPYIGFEDITFLKRSFVFDAELENYIGPLEKDSIYKMLHNYMDHKGTDALPEVISADSMLCALREMFRHGRKDYNELRHGLELVVKDCDFLHNMSLPTFLEQQQQYKKDYILTEEDVVKTFCFDLQDSGLSDECLDYPWGRALEQGMIEPVFVSQAGETEEAQHDQEETVQFTSNSPGVERIEQSSIDATRNVANPNDMDIGAFFGRPVQIFRFIWNQGTDLGTSFSPWDLFLNNPRVINRLNNYSLLNCTLHVRFVINGNPFLLGRMLCSYAPFATNVVSRPYSRVLVPSDAVGESQRLCAWLNPTNSTGADLELPFFFPRDNFSIVEADWSEMGDITMRPIPALASTNGATDGIDITVYAWATNVNLSVPTSFESSSLVPQSGRSDEFGKGVVSNIASNASSIASKLTMLPYIAPYAKATQMVASAIGSIAEVFGYSRPAIIADNTNVVNRYAGFSAIGSGGDTTAKLTLDPKQELTIDGATMGACNCDELNLKHLAGIESYLTTFPFQVADAPDQLLFTMRLSPAMFRTSTGPTPAQPEIHMTPSAAVGMCFDYWRGSMKIRFVICASNYQRGRLRVVWDPSGATPASSPDYNVVNSEVLDIAECQDKTYCVGWGNTRGYLRYNAIRNTTTQPFLPNAIDPIGPISASQDFFNGTISVYVVNSLVNPGDSTTSAQVNVYTSMCDDVKFGSVSNAELNEFSLFAPQSGHSEEFMFDQVQSGVEGQAHNTFQDPLVDEEITYFSSLSDNGGVDAVYMGETIVSARSLIKRYVHLRTDNLDGEGAGNTPSRWGLQRTVLMGFRGFDPNGEDTRDGSQYGYFGVPFAQWFIPFFAGWRGSVRYKVVYQGDTTGLGAAIHGLMAGTRVGPNAVRQITSSVYTAADAARDGALYYETSGQGIEFQPSEHKSLIEFEIPYQMNQRFSYGLQLNNTLANNMPGMAVLVVTNANTAKLRTLDTFSSAGEDFLMGFFSGIPPMFSYADL